ncbi:MAG TPA: ATP-binding cassette domain-containing protein [Sporichthyaceae bacterium]|jgi:ABC-2 type transport system ATP-binding protein
MNAYSGAIPHQATGSGAAGVIRAGGTIRVENLVKQYGSTKAVDELSFEVAPGQVTGFLGPNGAGKTTTMRCILGLDAPSSGRVTIGGRAYRDLPAPLREVGALIDPGAVHPKRTAHNHLLALAQSNGIAAKRVGEVLGMVGLESVAGKRVGGFSLGMNQRLGIAAALLGDPPVLMFDEPVNGLDPEGIVWVRKFMQSLAAEGRTVFVSSHLMSEMALMAEHVIVIGRGRLLRDQTVAEFVATSSEHHVLVRARDLVALDSVLTGAGAKVRPASEGGLEVFGLDAAAIGELAASRFIALHELSPQRGSLEEAFMKLTQDSVEYSASVNS